MKGLKSVLMYGLASLFLAVFFSYLYEFAGEEGNKVVVYGVMFMLTFIALSHIPGLRAGERE